jgi:hypothetical protein
MSTDQIQLRYHRGTVYWQIPDGYCQIPNAGLKMKAILVGVYLGVSLAIVLACIPAWYAQMVPDPVWVKAHQSIYLWLAAAYIALVLFIRALIRWQGLGTWLAVKFFTVIGALILIALLGLFFGPIGAGIALMCCLGIFECCCDRERREREERIIVSKRPERPETGVSLSRGEKRLLRASVIVAGLFVWVLLGSWYMSDASRQEFVPPEAKADYSQNTPLIHNLCVESTQTATQRNA